MSTNYVPETDNSSEGNSPRRSNRRGGRSSSGDSRRSSGGNRSSSSRSSGGASESRTRKPEPKPQGIVEKIASFLGFGSKEPQSIPASRPPRSAEELAATGSGGRRSSGGRERGERSERGERADRPERNDRSDRVADRAPRDRESRSRGTGMRSPEIVEVTTPRLYIGNLSFDAGESELSELFNGVGSVQNVEIVTNRQTERPKGFAFVQMESVDEAKRAVTELHDKEFMGRKLVVSGAKASERRDERVRDAAPAEADTSTEATDSHDEPAA
jgi:hypothetical protein